MLKKSRFVYGQLPICIGILLASWTWIKPAQAQDSPIAQTLPPIEQLQSSRACQKCDLRNANLSGFDLSNTDLRGANLSNANLSGTNLSGANLTEANLYLAKLSNSNLKAANLHQSNLKGTALENADLTGSTLTDADLSYAKLSGANLSQADLSRSKLDTAELIGTNLTSAKLLSANLGYANLTNANVERADFSRANFSSVDLTGVTNLGTANFAEANLQGANLAGAETPETQQVATTVPEQSENKHSSEPNNSEQNNNENKKTPFTAEESPLANIPFQRPTAQHLREGDFVLGIGSRFFGITSINAQGGDEGTPFWPTAGVRWGITNSSELGAAFYNFDAGSIEQQGAFDPFLVDASPTFDYAFEFKQQIWENSSETLAISGVVSLGGLEEPSFAFRGTNLVRNGNGIVPGLALPVTAKVNRKLNLTLSPTAAFFPSDSAIFLSVLPFPNSGSFGTNVGLTGAVSYQVDPRLLLWADAFFPVVGNNSVNGPTGLPDKTLAFNAGLRYLLNPRVGLDIYATNTFGTFGPAALTADNNNIGVGAGLVFTPNAKYPNNFSGQFNQKDTALTTDGLGFFDGGTVPAGKFLTQIQGGSNGVMTALRLGATRDLEIGTFLDYVFGNVDESEQGISGKVRFLNQGDGAPFTLSAVATFGVGNDPILNRINNNATFFENQGESKSFPFILGGRLSEGEGAYIATASLPMQYQFSRGTAIWATPTIGFVQQSGLAIAGLNVGGSVRVFGDVSILGEIGANFRGTGNTFANNVLADRIPWNFAVRWQPSRLLGLDYTDSLVRPSFEIFGTNRVGASAFQQLRVREGNDPAVGVGLSIPF